jgi:hypothetical protein
MTARVRAVPLAVALTVLLFLSYWVLSERWQAVESWPPAQLEDDSAKIGPLTAIDRHHLERQRELVDELARRYVGLSLSRSVSDLRTLQELIDQEIPTSDETYALQALGVALGDALAGQHPVTWVHVRDAYGETRGLQIADTKDLLFPLTMLSRRIEAGIGVDVQVLFGEAENTIARSLRRASLRRGGL